jgi:hypothetical protein
MSHKPLATNLTALKIHVIITYLEMNPNEVRQGDVVTSWSFSQFRKHLWGTCETYTFVFVVAHAIISLTAILRRPPVSGKKLCSQKESETTTGTH